MFSFFQHFRYFGFWIIDFIKGSKTKKHLQDIRFILNNYSHPKSKSKIKSNLEDILQHAVNTTDFYKNYKDFNDLNDFEVINKNKIIKEFNSFKSKTSLNKKLYTVSTSGSTGTSLTILQDRNKKLRNTADIIYFSNLAGYKIGYKLFYARHWDGVYKKSKILLWFQNIIPVEVINLNKESITSIIFKIKKGKSKKGLLGYASAFEAICRYLDKTNSKPIKSKVKSIIAISETLNAYTRQKMQTYFECCIVSRYSNMENGLIAQQTIKNPNDYTINWGSYHIEILDLYSNKPAKPGEHGRIIVTDLFNYAMPLIRYDTGDLGIIDHVSCPPVLKKVEGRMLDRLLNTKGEIISSLILTFLYDYKNINQYQLTQETQNLYILKLNVDDNFVDEKKITDILNKHLGNDAIINVVYVNKIPFLKSGKQKVIVNNYLSNKTV